MYTGEARERLIVALDVCDGKEAIGLAERLIPEVKYFKVGSTLINSAGGPQIVREINRIGGEVIYDPKLNDDPDTIRDTVRAVAALNVRMISIHASSGITALRVAVAHRSASLVLGVTVLTSLDEQIAGNIYHESVERKVVEFANDILAAGADGVSCSGRELKHIRKIPAFNKLLMVVSGIRTDWDGRDDHRCSMTAGEAIKAGADMLVIGRPIIRPSGNFFNDPAMAAKYFLSAINDALRLCEN